MQLIYTTNKSAGFTLIEVLLIAPIIILIIGVFIALIVNLTGESLVLRENNSILYDVQNSLDDIELAVNKSSTFVDGTPLMPPPFGKDNNNASFTAETGVGLADSLILLSPATTQNPYSPDRVLISTGAAPCNAAGSLLYFYTIYFVYGDTLKKRTVVPTTASCAGSWQRSSCTNGSPTCGSKDEILATGLTDDKTSFKVDYFNLDDTPQATPSLAKKATISIAASRQVAGKYATASGSLQVYRISERPFAGAAIPSPN